LFKPDLNDEAKDWFRRVLRQRYEFVDSRLQKSDYLASSNFTAADAYLYVVTNWASRIGVDLQNLSALDAFMKRVRERGAVQAALAAEGLVKKAA
jgi:glutathione S-transferase